MHISMGATAPYQLSIVWSTEGIDGHQTPPAPSKRKPTLPPPQSFVLPPAERRQVGCRDSWRGWLAARPDWWVHKCVECNQVAQLFFFFMTSEKAEERKKRCQAKPWGGSLKTHGWGRRGWINSLSPPLTSSPLPLLHSHCLVNMQHRKCHNKFVMEGGGAVPGEECSRETSLREDSLCNVKKGRCCTKRKLPFFSAEQNGEHPNTNRQPRGRKASVTTNKLRHLWLFQWFFLRMCF